MKPSRKSGSYQDPRDAAVAAAAVRSSNQDMAVAGAPRPCHVPRVPLVLLFGSIIGAVVVALTALIFVLDGLLMDEANRSARAALEGSLDHASVMVALPFAATEPLVARFAAEMIALNDTCSDNARTGSNMLRRWTSLQATMRGAKALQFHYLYEAHEVGGDFNTWSSCGCAGQEPRCDYQLGMSWNRVDASTFPIASTAVVENYPTAPEWNGTGLGWVESVRWLTIADKNGTWSDPTLWYDPSSQRSLAFISFIVPTRFNDDGHTTSAEVIDLLADGLSEQLAQVTLQETDVVLVHPKQKTLIATTFKIPLTKGTGADAVLWSMTETPSRSLNSAVAHFQPQLEAVARRTTTTTENEKKKNENGNTGADDDTVDFEKELILGFRPLFRGTLRLAIITVTKKEPFFRTAANARIVTIMMGLACAVVCIIVASVICAALFRSLSSLEKAMVPAARLRCDPAEFRAQGLSWISNIATLQAAFADMNEKLHEAGAYLPPSIRTMWTTNSELESDGSEADEVTSQKSGYTDRISTPGSDAAAAGNREGGAAASPAGAAAVLLMGCSITRQFKRTRIAVLQLNFVGFHAFIGRDFDKLEECSRLLTDLVSSSAKRNKGVVDTFQGDRYTITFNAVIPCSAANRKAVTCAFAIHKALSESHNKSSVANAPSVVGDDGRQEQRRSWGAASPPLPGEDTNTPNAPMRFSKSVRGLNTSALSASLSSAVEDGGHGRGGQHPELQQFGLCLSSGVAAGTATVGDVGSSMMRRFGIIGPVVARASVLERLCRSYTYRVAPLPSATTSMCPCVNFLFQTSGDTSGGSATRSARVSFQQLQSPAPAIVSGPFDLRHLPQAQLSDDVVLTTGTSRARENSAVLAPTMLVQEASPPAALPTEACPHPTETSCGGVGIVGVCCSEDQNSPTLPHLMAIHDSHEVTPSVPPPQESMAHVTRLAPLRSGAAEPVPASPLMRLISPSAPGSPGTCTPNSASELPDLAQSVGLCGAKIATSNKHGHPVQCGGAPPATTAENQTNGFGPPAAPCVVCPSVARDITAHFRIAAVDFVRLPGAPNAAVLSAVLGECSAADDDEWLYVVGDGADDAGAKAFVKAAGCNPADYAAQQELEEEVLASVSLARSKSLDGGDGGPGTRAMGVDPAMAVIAPVVRRNLTLLCRSGANKKSAGRPLGAFYEECVARSVVGVGGTHPAGPPLSPA